MSSDNTGSSGSRNLIARDLYSWVKVVVSVGFGLYLMYYGLDLAIEKPGLSKLAFTIVRGATSLGAGFVAAGILGSIEINATERASMTIRASGPIAVTALFYVLDGGAAAILCG